ncbi:LysR substrate-binding domain-containing protein [Novosphingobium terrae]|uniref:LysR substrate-binding domain-containing protein n=1 Tax=Novosphingobium terrae TaxID=2726189 RepID=UPI00197F54E4|nr:LysR substrate-binding domain-containing protein [Novosphingobium terrae]
MNAVDVRHLRYFAAVAQERHFGRAAVRLAITQPALSQQISALEAILGVQLLIRDRRNVAITEAGEAFLAGAQDLLQRIDALVETTRRVARHCDARVTIAMVEATNLPFLLPALADLRQLYPAIKVLRREMVSPQQVKALLAGEIDIGMGVLLGQEDATQGIATRPLLEGQWLVAVPLGHPLAAMERLTPKDLAREALMIFARSMNPPLYDQVIESFRKQGVEPNFVYETTQPQIGLTMAGEGAGLMIGADYVFGAARQNCVYRVLDGLPPLAVHIFWRRDETSGLIHDLIEGLIEKAGAAA